MHRLALVSIMAIFSLVACNPKIADGIRKNDLNRDVQLITTKGTITIRLSDSTPLHRNNFIRLVKQKFYDSISFHRVIRYFMIQAGDPATKNSGAKPFDYTIPAELRPSLFHKRGAVAAARMGNDVNPTRSSSGTQFYIVQGRTFTEQGLDSVETFRRQGKKLPLPHRNTYISTGGAPHLDQDYTVFGEVVSGMAVVDSIAAVVTSGRSGGDKPLQDVRIIQARLVRR